MRFYFGAVDEVFRKYLVSNALPERWQFETYTFSQNLSNNAFRNKLTSFNQIL